MAQFKDSDVRFSQSLKLLLPFRLAMIVAAIAFAQTSFLNFTYFLSYNQANLADLGLWPGGVGKRKK